MSNANYHICKRAVTMKCQQQCKFKYKWIYIYAHIHMRTYVHTSDPVKGDVFMEFTLNGQKAVEQVVWWRLEGV